MEITKLIEELKELAEWAESNEWETPITLSDTLQKAAETIRLLQELAVDASNEKYKRLLDGGVEDAE